MEATSKSQVARLAVQTGMSPEELRAEADRLEREAKEAAERAKQAAREQAEAARQAAAAAEQAERVKKLDEIAASLVALIGEGFVAKAGNGTHERQRRVYVRAEGSKHSLAVIEVSECHGSYHRRDGYSAVVFAGDHEHYGRDSWKSNFRADKAEKLNTAKMAARAVEFARMQAEKNAAQAERDRITNINDPLAKGLLAEFGFEDYRSIVEPSTREEGRVHLELKTKLYDITPERARAILAALRDVEVEL
jgi:hypothetical protein